MPDNTLGLPPEASLAEDKPLAMRASISFSAARRSSPVMGAYRASSNIVGSYRSNSGSSPSSSSSLSIGTQFSSAASSDASSASLKSPSCDGLCSSKESVRSWVESCGKTTLSHNARMRLGVLSISVNQLQEVLAACQDSADSINLFSLPQVAVVGSQSVGKSSILEGLMKRSCLPKGNGMITRCPLIIQLHHLTEDKILRRLADTTTAFNDESDGTPFYAEFVHAANRIFRNDDEIMLEIVKRTDEILAAANEFAGEKTAHDLSVLSITGDPAKITEGGKLSEASTAANTSRKRTPPDSPRAVAAVVSPMPIILKMYSPDVVDLTLIDLPGLVRVPTSDQPRDIEQIVLKYVNNPSCIILAVSAANVDLANSDSLRIAREVDPDGMRTIGVLTKCDLVEDCHTLLPILEGRMYPLEPGYVLVKCRGCGESSNLYQSLENEKRFFQQHPVLSQLSCCNGIEQLGGKLSSILSQHICVALPTLRTKVDLAICSTREKLAELSAVIDASSPDAGAKVLQLFTRYSKMVDDLLDGRAIPTLHYKDSRHMTRVLDAEELIGGARLHYIFHDWFAACVMRLNPLAGLSDKEIRVAIRNASGSSTSLFVPESAFEMLVRRQIKKLEQPAVQCVQQALHELVSIVDFPLVNISEFSHHLKLKEAVKAISRQVIDEHLASTLKAVTDFIQVELAFINKSHPDFMSGKRAIAGFLSAAGERGLHVEKNHVDNVREKAIQSGGGNTPTTKLSDSDEARRLNLAGSAATNQQQQGFLSFWRKHPLQQTPAPLSCNRPLGAKTAMPLDLPIVEPFNHLKEDLVYRDGLELELVKALITSYFEIIKKTLSDLVPKSIMHFLVNATRGDLQRELIARLYREDRFGELLAEDAETPKARHQLNQRLATLKAAETILQNMTRSLIK